MIEPDVIVVAAGPGPALDVPLPGIVVAADSGLERAAALGLDVDIVVGDFDSAPVDLVTAAEAAGARVVRHPVAKNATDLELALDEALGLGARRVLLVASTEGRLDHLLSLLLLLGSERYRGLELDALVGEAFVQVIRGDRTLTGKAGEILTLVAVGGAVEAITTQGLEYPLSGETLEAGTTRGVSNVFTGPQAHVSVGAGVLLAIRPHASRPQGAGR